MQFKQKGIFIGALMLVAAPLMAAETAVDVFLLNDDQSTKGIGEKIGTIEFSDSDKGLVIKPKLTGLTPGEHGFHIHENGSCEGAEKEGKWVPGVQAGGHFDPAHSDKHLGPKGKGHKGDLPVLMVNKNGEANEKSLAPHLTVMDLRGHSVMIHEGGDNYSDNPKPLGGGGARIACGVFP